MATTALHDRPPLVSIGLPVYNGERFLAQTLDSIRAQTFTDFEIVISDNASTDGTEAICRAYAERDSRIRYVRTARNLGASRNFNRVFTLSRGTYFKWWAADDLCAPTFLERCVAALERDPGASLVHTRARCIDECGRILHSYEEGVHHEPWSDNKSVRFRQLVDEYVYSGGVTAAIYVFGLTRASAMRRTRLLGNYIAADWITVAELMLLGRVIELPEYLTLLRAHPGSMSLGSHAHQPAQVQEFFDPAVRGRLLVGFSGARRYWEHFVVVMRAPLSPWQKADLLTYTMGTMMKRAQRRLSKLVSAA